MRLARNIVSGAGEAYQNYIAASHAVHDAPTHNILREIIAAKEPQLEWFAAFKTRDNAQIDGEYANRVRAFLETVGEFCRLKSLTRHPLAKTLIS